MPMVFGGLVGVLRGTKNAVVPRTELNTHAFKVCFPDPDTVIWLICMRERKHWFHQEENSMFITKVEKNLQKFPMRECECSYIKQNIVWAKNNGLNFRVP